MSNIIAFRPDRAGRFVRRDGDLGRILFFTGVRYVRDEAPVEPTPVKRPKAPSKRKSRAVQAERMKA